MLCSIGGALPGKRRALRAYLLMRFFKRSSDSKLIRIKKTDGSISSKRAIVVADETARTRSNTFIT